MHEKSERLGTVGETVRTRVRELRTGRGMSQAGLSARTEKVGRLIDPQRIQRIETGQSRIDVDDLAVLARALGVSPASLMVAVSDKVNVDRSPVDIVVMVDSPDHEFYRHPHRVARSLTVPVRSVVAIDKATGLVSTTRVEDANW